MRRVGTETTGNRRGRRSRAEILDVAARLMAERGYAATTLSVLSAETGLPKSAIYHHFQSKGGLLSAVLERGRSDFFEAMRAAHADPPQDGAPRERIAWFVQRTVEVLADRQDYLRLHMILLLSAEAAEAEVSDAIRALRREGRVGMNHLIREAFRDRGRDVAQAIADELDVFSVAGLDGMFIAMQADATWELPTQAALLADAIAALGEAIAERHPG
jgi:AcrR family transcriptional regulator